LAFQKIMSKYLDRQFARRLQERLKPHEIVCRLSLYWSDPQDA
jgi:hypothetical protein